MPAAVRAAVSRRDLSPDGQVDLVALSIGEGPPLGCVRVADQVAAGGERGRDARLHLVVGQVDVDAVFATDPC